MVDEVAERVALPVIGGRCEHALPVRASCRACVDACPRQGLFLNDHGLYLDIENCDGCGFCASACAAGAISVPVEPLIDGDPSACQAFAACHATPLGAGGEQPGGVDAPGSPCWFEGPAMVPCLHGLGLEALAELYLRGVRELVLARAPCETCPSGAAPRLSARVASFNGLLSPKSMDQMRIVELPPAQWRQRRDAAVETAKKAIRSAIGACGFFARRALLVGRAPAEPPAIPVESAQEVESSPDEPEEQPLWRAPAQKIPRGFVPKSALKIAFCA
jgi:NAD-dependent dihydropyrimidine dehydrogenase PreA subunit